jgi:four helix bundle protein
VIDLRGNREMGNIIVEKSFEFAVKIARLAREVKEEAREYELGSQLIRSGTSIGANVAEAQQGQSRKYFISKMSIALKEAAETEYWLELLHRTEFLQESAYQSIIADSQELCKLLTVIVRNSK